MLHTFKDGVCSTCGTSLSYLLDVRYGSTIGPKPAAMTGQLELPYTLDVMEYAYRLH
jgi:hypothetical protein